MAMAQRERAREGVRRGMGGEGEEGGTERSSGGMTDTHVSGPLQK